MSCYKFFTAHTLLIIALILPSCAKYSQEGSSTLSPLQTFLCIEMPRSNNVFENITPLLYKALWNHFQRAAFKLVSQEQASYRLVCFVRRFDTDEKLISPDVIPYAFRVWVELECTLYDKQGKKCAHKIFNFSSWASRPLDLRFTSHFETAEYERVFQRFVPRVDHYFRRFFVPVTK